MLGAYRFVQDQPINIRHPIYPSEEIKNAKYTGETFRGKAQGLGEFTWGEVLEGKKLKFNKCSGLFKEGQLQGQALILRKEGGRGSCTFVDGLSQGSFDKWYYPEGTKGLVMRMKE